MTARKIVIRDCGECPRSDHKGAFGKVSRIPVCRKADRELPWTPIASSDGFVRAKRGSGIPDWCPLPKDTNDAQELEQISERFQARRMADIQARERAEFSASQCQQRADLAERQRDELAELLYAKEPTPVQLSDEQTANAVLLAYMLTTTDRFGNLMPSCQFAPQKLRDVAPGIVDGFELTEAGKALKQRVVQMMHDARVKGPA